MANKGVSAEGAETAPAPARGGVAADYAAPRWSLVAPEAELFDAAAVQADLDAIAASGKDSADKRAAATRRLRTELDRGRERVRAAFEKDHRVGYAAARSLAWGTDQVLIAAFSFVADRLHHLGSPTVAEQVAMVAVGGYGRGELAPFSDIDLLFVTPYKQTAWGESVIESTLYMLWDLKLKIGHATRSIDECLRRASGDITIRTALLEKRHLVGAEDLYRELDRRLWSELFDRTGPEFVSAKLAERDARHLRTGGSRYLLEPNVKESKGGLRDLHTLFWLAKYLYHAESPTELVAKGVFDAEEAARSRWAMEHLWTIRLGLHYAAGRAQEKLTFDQQIELAERFGFREARGQLPVERFMKRYFLSAKAVGDLTGIFCAALEAEHKKSPPLLGGLIRFLSGSNFGGAAVESEWSTVKDGRLTIPDPDLFEKRPIAIFRLFREAIRAGLAVHPEALRAVDRSRRRVDEELRVDPQARALFLDLMTTSEDPIRALRMMSVTGVLGRFVPEFGRVVGQMQFNMYHHYTVDEHSILAVETLHKMVDGQLKAEHPIETDIAASLPSLRVMAVTLLLHDAGKGLPEDHSIVGERIARDVCPALGMTPAETEQVAWLIRYHLSMSDVAQKRDLSEPATIRAFAQLVRSPARLRLLYLLTACDIRAVGPGVWNGWKGQLLRQLYRETMALLTGEAFGASRAERVRDAQEALRASLAEEPHGKSEAGDDARHDWGAEALRGAVWTSYVDRFSSTYWTALPIDSHRLHARLIGPDRSATPARAEDPMGSEIRMSARSSSLRDATEFAFYTPDHPGLFARMAGAFALVGASVVDAHAFTTKDGMAVNSFWVQDDEGGPYRDPVRLRGSVEKLLKGEVVAREALKARRKLRKREQSFEVTPSVDFDNDAAELLTVVEVNCRDRVGLLHDLARALASENINIVSAIIATYGEHVVDVFYVKDLFGMKVTQTGKQRRIERALLTAIDKSAPG